MKGQHSSNKSTRNTSNVSRMHCLKANVFSGTFNPCSMNGSPLFGNTLCAWHAFC